MESSATLFAGAHPYPMRPGPLGAPAARFDLCA